MKPPNFRFLTPSGRFEVNREICLSISGFHEETWQPAWGVRLALTALRGFMGEEGTAGQVGGLESSRGVRERLARESKSWRCPGCGGEEEGENKRGWTNEERMKWWWGVCQGRGVNVEAEVEGLEDLPDGMEVEARDVKVDIETQKDNTVGRNEEQVEPNLGTQDSRSEALALPPIQSNNVPGEATRLSHPSTIPSPAASPASQSPPSTSQSPPEIVTTPNLPNISYRPHNRGTSTDTLPAPQQQQQQQFQHLQPTQQRPADYPITIDRAIAGVFLALCIMILKRMLYPSSSGGMFGGYDDLRMMRE